MFAYIKGIIKEKEILSSTAYRLILECHGFGLEMQISHQTYIILPDPGEEAQIHTVFVIKETEYLLFGFATAEEKELFLILTSVSGVGPKLALGLLGTFSPEQLSGAIIEEDERLITQAPGVGAKVAGRIILELKTKIENWQQKNMIGKQYSQGSNSKQESAVDEEVRTILGGLGYSPSEIMQAISAIKKRGTGHDVESLVKESLKLLGSSSLTH